MFNKCIAAIVVLSNTDMTIYGKGEQSRNDKRKATVRTNILEKARKGAVIHIYKTNKQVNALKSEQPINADHKDNGLKLVSFLRKIDTSKSVPSTHYFTRYHSHSTSCFAKDTGKSSSDFVSIVIATNSVQHVLLILLSKQIVRNV